MMRNHFSIILLPTNKCNVNCEYCFEDKTDDRMTLDQLAIIMRKVFDYMDEASIRGLTIHWQGGEAMLMPIDWFERARFVSADSRYIRASDTRTRWRWNAFRARCICDNWNNRWSLVGWS